MEKLRLSASDFMNITGQPKSTVYNWMTLGKLETETGIKGKKIIITKDELESLTIQNIPEIIEPIPENSQTNPEPIQDNPKSVQKESTLDLLEYVRPFMEKAGKVQLLEDLSKQKEKDLDYWKEQYFNMKFQKESLRKFNIPVIITLVLIVIISISVAIFFATRPPIIKEKIVEKPVIKTITKTVPKYIYRRIRY
ncbi:MAG: hypothetical protein US20_C0023G0003 [Candidatus Pacebacteria bacterium GW2011_GWF1_36_5]|nr:MAG: hypothetical protein US20_C0023G0003 [Candidatus Pacebacteria bacterium GW2011_GWF1_36_5]